MTEAAATVPKGSGSDGFVAGVRQVAGAVMLRTCSPLGRGVGKEEDCGAF